MNREVTAPPTSENWIAAGLFVIAAVFAFAATPAAGPVWIAAGLYAVALAVGVWLPRPRDGQRFAFRLMMIPLLLQAAVYALYSWSLAQQALADITPDPAMIAAGRVALVFFLAGWAPCLVLRRVSRQTMFLLAIEAIAPAVAVLVFLLRWLQGIR